MMKTKLGLIVALWTVIFSAWSTEAVFGKGSGRGGRSSGSSSSSKSGGRSGGYVKGYTRSNGTYVHGYYRGGSAPTRSGSMPSGFGSSTSSPSSFSRGKTVHVRSYYRKDGTFVHSYWRRPPGAGSDDSNSSLGVSPYAPTDDSPVSSASPLIVFDQDEQHQNHVRTRSIPLESGFSYVAGYPVANVVKPSWSFGDILRGKVEASPAPVKDSIDSTTTNVVLSIGKEDFSAPNWQDEQKVLVHFGQEMHLYPLSSRDKPTNNPLESAKVADIIIPVDDFVRMSQSDHICLVLGDVSFSLLLSGERLRPLKELAKQLPAPTVETETTEAPFANPTLPPPYHAPDESGN